MIKIIENDYAIKQDVSRTVNLINGIHHNSEEYSCHSHMLGSFGKHVKDMLTIGNDGKTVYAQNDRQAGFIVSIYKDLAEFSMCVTTNKLARADTIRKELLTRVREYK